MPRSCAADDERVYVFFASSGVIAYDLDGKELWKQSVGTDSLSQFGSASSPIVWKDLVIVTACSESSSSWAFDKKTGKPIEDPEKRTSATKNTKDICPSAMGGKNQQPVSFSPKTGYFYVPSNNLCMDYEGVEVKYQAGQPYVGAIVVSKAGPGGNRG